MCFTLGIICYLLYVLLVFIQHKVYSIVGSLSEIEKGEIFGLSIGILSSGLAFSVLLAVTLPIVFKISI
jgi:hypothetical protein